MIFAGLKKVGSCCLLLAGASFLAEGSIANAA